MRLKNVTDFFYLYGTTLSWRKDKRSSSERGYGYKWRKAREGFLRNNPLCEYCIADGKVEPATVVNHKVPHRGDQQLFWDRDNWAAVCKQHHDSTIAKEESRGVKIGGDVSGNPLDPNHHWNK